MGDHGMRGWRQILLMTSAAALCAVPLLALGQANSGGSSQRQDTTQIMPSEGDQATPRQPAAPGIGTGTGATTPGMAVDSERLQGGRRASRVIGATIYNAENDTIGSVDDLIVPPGGGQPVAVLAVGGFLGIGARLVAIPYERLLYNPERERWMLPGATRDSLRALPAYSYEEDGLRRRG
jgi:hypothetical protein